MSIPSTPQPAFEPRSTIIRASIPVKVPSLRAPTFMCVTCAEAGFVAWKSSPRVSTSRTGTLQRERRTDRERLDERELPAEGPTQRLGDHADALEREVEGARELAPRDERALRARGDDERARGLEPGGAHLRLEVRLIDPGRPERSLDDHVTRGEGRGDIASFARVRGRARCPESSSPGSSSWPWSTPA